MICFQLLVLAQLLEFWAISNKMIAIEEEERTKVLSTLAETKKKLSSSDSSSSLPDASSSSAAASGAGDDEDDFPKPQPPEFPPYPRYNINESLVIKLLDSSYIRWDINLLVFT
jgi:hypothetical protein